MCDLAKNARLLCINPQGGRLDASANAAHDGAIVANTLKSRAPHLQSADVCELSEHSGGCIHVR